MKNLIYLILLGLASCTNTNESEKSKLEIFDEAMTLLMADNSSEILTPIESKTLHVKVSDKNLLKSVTEAKVGETIYVKLNNVITNKFIISEPISSGIVILHTDEASSEIFDNESEVVKNLLNFE